MSLQTVAPVHVIYGTQRQPLLIDCGPGLRSRWSALRPLDHRDALQAGGAVHWLHPLVEVGERSRAGEKPITPLKRRRHPLGQPIFEVPDLVPGDGGGQFVAVRDGPGQNTRPLVDHGLVFLAVGPVRLGFQIELGLGGSPSRFGTLPGFPVAPPCPPSKRYFLPL